MKEQTFRTSFFYLLYLFPYLVVEALLFSNMAQEYTCIHQWQLFGLIILQLALNHQQARRSCGLECPLWHSCTSHPVQVLQRLKREYLLSKGSNEISIKQACVPCLRALMLYWQSPVPKSPRFHTPSLSKKPSDTKISEPS